MSAQQLQGLLLLLLATQQQQQMWHHHRSRKVAAVTGMISVRVAMKQRKMSYERKRDSCHRLPAKTCQQQQNMQTHGEHAALQAELLLCNHNRYCCLTGTTAASTDEMKGMQQDDLFVAFTTSCQL
jgi:hypothetical protein